MYKYKIYNNSIDYSGNNTTLTRLSKILNIKITNKIQNNIIGIHAYKFGKLVIDKNIIFILIIGGTDINIDVYNFTKFIVINKCLKQAKFIICFNKYIYNKMLLLNIDINKLKIIKQSVPRLKIKIKNNLRNFLSINTKKIYLAIGNIRPVKDIYYLKDIFSIHDMTLVIIGNLIKGEKINYKNIIHIGPVNINYIYGYLKQSNGLINSSKSEGMSISILEAMKLKCPVYVRNNNGNKSIVKDYYNGFIFNNPNQFYFKSKLNTNEIIKNAFRYVNTIHNIYIEKLKYINIL